MARRHKWGRGWKEGKKEGVEGGGKWRKGRGWMKGFEWEGKREEG